jgi:ribose-phosphate pyrophosphokinase
MLLSARDASDTVPARDRLVEAPIKEVAVTNTIAIPESHEFDKLTVLSVGELLAKAVRLTHAEQSVSSLFEEQVPAAV